MLYYIIRLDDACPKMNHEMWRKVENLLDSYDIRPIVGIIPDNKDELFTWSDDPDFWSITVKRWQKKGWTIAQHGCHHSYHICKSGMRSEFIDLDYEEQKKLIDKGYQTMISHQCIPTCFFAPAHSFDHITVDVCRDNGYFDFISDGYALYPYRERGMLFLPALFDTAHKIFPFGVYTFILHPSFVTDRYLQDLDKFIKKHRTHFITISEIMKDVDLHRNRTIFDKMIEKAIKTVKKIRNKLKKR